MTISLFGRQEQDPDSQSSHYIPIILIISIITGLCRSRNPQWRLAEKAHSHQTHHRDYQWIGWSVQTSIACCWLANIHETYPDGPVATADHTRDCLLEVDVWVPDAHGLYANWSPAVVVLISKFSAMNTHPNAVSDLVIIYIIVI